MKVKNIQLILVLFLSPLTAFTQTGNFTIIGKVNSKFNGAYIKLFYQQNEAKVADSTQIKNGAFKLTGKLNAPTVGIISLGGPEDGDRINLFLSEGIIKMAAKDSIHYARISGTKLAEEHELLAKKLRPSDDKIYKSIKMIKSLPDGDEQKQFVKKFLADLDVHNDVKRTSINQFAKDNPSSYVSLYFLDNNAPGKLLNYEATYPQYMRLSAELRETPLGIEFGKRILEAKGKLTGRPSIDFVSTTPDGTQLSLKEVIGKNKYTLVDFWASWCGPCRKENPYVVKTFNGFKDKGFTVLSVSLDEDAAKWKDAIEKDGMPWYHVSSLKGWEEPAAALYNVRAIPQNVLIDGHGKIVATNLRGETLFDKIQELIP